MRNSFLINMIGHCREIEFDGSRWTDKNLKGEIQQLQEAMVIKADLAPTCRSFVPSIYPQAELRKADQVSSIWSALPGFESTDSDSGDKWCIRPTRTQAFKRSKDKPPVTKITHKSASPKQLDEWSKTLSHPQDVGMKTWDHLKWYQKLYNLNPYDWL